MDSRSDVKPRIFDLRGNDKQESGNDNVERISQYQFSTRRNHMKKMKKEANEIEELKQKAGEYLAGWQRTQADMSNLRKQMEKEQIEFVRFANASLVCEILPIIDNFDRALKASTDLQITNNTDNTDFIKGVEAIRDQLAEVLKKHGVTKIECVGKPFNPAEHEALMSEESKEHPEDMVIAELEAGYKLNDKVIRPSKVKISKKNG
jgi:molecular chaperone GrpE